jgi:hypothetical protein
MVASKAGWELVPKDVLKGLFDALDEETVRKVAERTAKSSKDHRLMLTGVDDLESLYATTRYRVKKSGFVIREYDDHDGLKKFAIQHEMGLKWSIFFKEYHTQIVNDFGHTAEIEISANSVIMTIK